MLTAVAATVRDWRPDEGGSAFRDDGTVLELTPEGLKRERDVVPGSALELRTNRLFDRLIMLLLGSGPVKGFAVVLLIGIATSVFTAVVFTRMLVSIWVRKNRPTEIHI